MDQFFPKSFAKWKINLFKLFSLINSKRISPKASRLIVGIGLFIQKLNLISLVVFSGSGLNKFSFKEFIPLIFGYLRADVLFIQQNYQFLFTDVVIIMILLNIFAKLVLFGQIF